MGIYLISFTGNWYGQQVVNTIKYNINPVPTNLSPLIEAIGTAFKTAVFPAMHGGVQYTSMHVRSVQPAQPGVDFVPTTWPFVGGRTGTPMPSFVAVAGKLQGLELAYPFRGAVRLPGVVEEDVSSGLLAAGTATTLWQTAVDFWKQTITVGSDIAVPVLWTERFAPASNIINSVSLNLRVSTQNSRKVGRGG